MLITTSGATSQRNFSLEFKPKKDENTQKRQSAAEKGQKGLPDPRSYFRIMYDYFVMTPGERAFYSMRDKTIYNVKKLFGFKVEEKLSWFDRLMGKDKNNSSSSSSGGFNFFGAKESNSGSSWNPFT